MKMEYMYFQSPSSLLVLNEARSTSNFWFHFLTPLVPKLFCPYFAYIGPQPSFTPPPPPKHYVASLSLALTESKIPWSLCWCWHKNFGTKYYLLQIPHKQWHWPKFSSLCTFAKLSTVTISFIMSIHLHGMIRLPLDEFLWNLMFEDFLQNCQI